MSPERTPVVLTRWSALALVGLVLTGVLPAGPPRAETPESKGPFAAKLLDAVREYTTFGRVDDETRWAPWLCREPLPSQGRLSASKDDDTHGRKMYFVFAKDRPAYVSSEKAKTQKVGQVIVKESWEPEEVPEGSPVRPVWRERKGPLGKVSDSFIPYARRDGKLYRAGKQGPLFVMLKLDPKTPETDDGWVYGTVRADRKQVTSGGRVAACMKCHQEAKQDRLFGLPAVAKEK